MRLEPVALLSRNMLTTTVTGLGGLLCTQGRYGEAQDLYRRLLDADREERT